MRARLIEDFICGNLEPLRVYCITGAACTPFAHSPEYGFTVPFHNVIVRTTHEMGAAFAEWKCDLSKVEWAHDQPQVVLRLNDAGLLKGLKRVATLARKEKKKMDVIPSKEEQGRIERATMGSDPHYNGPYNQKLRWRVLSLMSAWHREYKTTASFLQWWTVQVLAECANGTETSVSSAIRDLRKKRCGSHIVIRQRGKGGLSEYSLLPGQDTLSAMCGQEPTPGDVISEAMRHGDSVQLVVKHELA